MKFHTIVVDTRQLNTIVAALRLYEAKLVTGEQIPAILIDIAGINPLDTKEINDLCEKLRRGE